MTYKNKQDRDIFNEQLEVFNGTIPYTIQLIENSAALNKTYLIGETLSGLSYSSNSDALRAVDYSRNVIKLSKQLQVLVFFNSKETNDLSLDEIEEVVNQCCIIFDLVELTNDEFMYFLSKTQNNELTILKENNLMGQDAAQFSLFINDDEKVVISDNLTNSENSKFTLHNDGLETEGIKLLKHYELLNKAAERQYLIENHTQANNDET